MARHLPVHQPSDRDTVRTARTAITADCTLTSCCHCVCARLVCTGNSAVAGIGLSLMEESSTGQFGQIQSSAWSVSISPAQPTSVSACPATLGDQSVNVYTFNLLYQALCGSTAAIPGCSAGTGAGNAGYYTLNLTLFMLTSPVPASGAGVNVAYQVCQLLPGSQRTTWVSLNGSTPVSSSTPISLVALGTANTGFGFKNLYYPYSFLNGANGGATSSLGLNYYFDADGIVYSPSTPWLGAYSVLNLCTGNPTGGSTPDQLAEEDAVVGSMGVVSGFQVTTSMQPYAQQTSFYFCYSATGPLVPNTAAATVSTGWATVITGTVTALLTPSSGVYQLIGLAATRTSTNFAGAAVSSPLSLVGAGLAGSNNNLLYINSSLCPLGIDGNGWGYTSTAPALFPLTATSSVTAPAGSYVRLANGVVETVSGQSTVYSNPSLTFVPYMTGSAPACSLPSSGTVATFPSSGTVYVNQTVYVPVNQTVYVPVNQTVYVTVNQTVYVPVNQTVYVPGQNVTTTVYASSGSSGSSLSNGAIAGIVIGCSLGVGLLVGVCCFILLRGVAVGKGGSSDASRFNSNRLSETSKVDHPTEDPTRREVEMVTQDD